MLDEIGTGSLQAPTSLHDNLKHFNGIYNGLYYMYIK